MEETYIDPAWFRSRLSRLREQRHVSAREMSLDMGHGPGYMNNLENGGNYPSMDAFLEICDYLRISPAEFFSDEEDSLLFARAVAILRRVSEEKRRAVIDLLEDQQ